MDLGGFVLCVVTFATVTKILYDSVRAWHVARRLSRELRQLIPPFDETADLADRVRKSEIEEREYAERLAAENKLADEETAANIAAVAARMSEAEKRVSDRLKMADFVLWPAPFLKATPPQRPRL